ncbi:hypothetical protein F4560_004425 [Saccharothrix ecbatanensis]|uniref:Uncharacterized protein n=1 Tax=Saccharothrix ecbatanensis TaxID=1105145 RepID=A0A7W9M279_9PSEU|nr:hypothetical protein [Saccharothrix ecbatanensis]MBB5804657.1 hypothetical protein [Saccharothrix ecbatanensis]
MTAPIPTSSRQAKAYLHERLDALLTDYDANIAAIYGPPAEDNLANTIMIGDINYESVDTASIGRRININEVYNIECAVVIAQQDGNNYDVEQTAFDLYAVIEAEVRDNPTLGNTVDFVTCKLQSVQSAPGVNGGAVCALLFNVECRKNLR